MQERLDVIIMLDSSSHTKFLLANSYDIVRAVRKEKLLRHFLCCVFGILIRINK